MKNLKLLLALVIIIGSVAVLAGLHEKDSHNGNPEMVYPAAEDQGEQVYNNHCISCHQKDGSGVPSMYPPLKEDKRVLGDKEPLIKVLLKGESGPVLNKGKYMGAMAPYKHLSDQKIADVLTYIRTNFGNEAGEVTAKEVAGVRQTLE